MWNFTHFFPLIVVDLIPENDEGWLLAQTNNIRMPRLEQIFHLEKKLGKKVTKIIVRHLLKIIAIFTTLLYYLQQYCIVFLL